MSSLPPPLNHSQLQDEEKNPSQFQQSSTQPYIQQGIPPQFLQQGQPQPMMQPVQHVVVSLGLVTRMIVTHESLDKFSVD